MADTFRDDSGKMQLDLKNQAVLVKKLQKEIETLAKLKNNLIEGDKVQLSLISEQTKKVEKLKKLQKERAKEIKDETDNMEEYSDTLISIGNTMKKNNKLLEIQKLKFEGVKSISEAIGDELADGAVTNQKVEKKVRQALAAYKEMQISIDKTNKSFALGRISEEQRLDAIREATEQYEDISSLVDKTQITSEGLLNALEAMDKETEMFSKSMQKAQIHSERLDKVFENFDGIPALGEVNKLLKTNIKDTVAFKAAVFALGAALGKAAYDYFGAPIKAAIQADKERKQEDIDATRDIAKIRKDAESIPAQINQEKLEHELNANEEIRKLNIDAQFAAQKAAIQFSDSLQQGAAEFRAASKTALFGKGLGSVGYGAAQMQLAGIDAKQVADAMSSAAAATGKMPTAKAAADMAIMAARTGTSVDDISQITEHFQRIDGMSANMAMNMAEGMRNMADQAGISLGNLMKEVAESSKDALGYQIKSGPALAKQVAYAQSLGVNFGDVAKAGKNMVMNYKDSIKAEMQLSSLLGEQVDLSEVRAKFAAGDTSGALEALKAQGLNPEDMDMFQQDALSQALGGMDLQSLSKVATGTGAQTGNLTAGNAGKGNQQFLGATQAAQASLASEQASISAKTAVVDAELSKKIGEAYLEGTGYENYKKEQAKVEEQARELAKSMTKAWLATDEYKKSLADTMKLNFVDSIKESLMGGLAMAAGGLLTTGVSKLFGKKGGGGAPAAAAAPTGGGAPEGGGGGSIVTSAAAAGADALIPGSGAVVEGAAGAIEEVKGKVEETMSLGEKLKDFGKGLGSVLKEVGKGIGDFLKNTGKGIGQFLKQIGSGLGKAIGGFFSGISAGLTTFAEAMAAPTPLFGLPAGLIIVGMAMGIAEALKIAGPGIQAITPLLLGLASIIGDTFVKVLQTAGPIIESIFNGIAKVITSVGNMIATVFNSITTSIGNFAKMDAAALASVAGSITKLSLAIAAFGAGSILDAIGNFFGGDIFSKLKDISGYSAPIMATAVAVQALANAFGQLSSIDVGALNKVPWGDMEDFASEGGKFVLAQSGGGSFALSKQTTDDISKMNTAIQANLQVSKNLQALLAVLSYEKDAAFQLNIDGNAVTNMLSRRADNRKGMNTSGGK